MLICNFWQKKWNGSYFIFIPPLTSYFLASPQTLFSFRCFQDCFRQKCTPKWKLSVYLLYPEKSKNFSTGDMKFQLYLLWNLEQLGISVSSLSKVFCFVLDSRNHRANISVPSEVVVPNHRGFCIPGNVWQCQEVFLICHSFGECIVARRQRTAMLLNILPHTGPAHTQNVNKCQGGETLV